MKHLKKFNETHTTDVCVMDDIKDILHDLEDVKYTYPYSRIISHIEDNVVTLYDHRLSPFIIEDLDDVVGRIKDYLKTNGIYYKITYQDKSSHYFTKKDDFNKYARWHPTAKSIKITINKKK